MPGALEGILRLLFSVIAGGLLGYERKRVGKPAGTRTHALVSLGACLFALASLWMGEVNEGADVTRIAAQVVVGVGFLGAGAIMSYGGVVKGLTTAATLWISAGLGLAIGLGIYLLAISAFVLVWFTLFLVPRIEKPAYRGLYPPRILRILTTDDPAVTGSIHRLFDQLGIGVEEMEFEKISPHTVELVYEIHLPEAIQPQTVVEQLKMMEKIQSVKFLP